MDEQAPAVELKAITKTFPGVVANDDVNLTVTPGEIHAVVGENGAGKSTLMKILYGMIRPDGGTISVNGREVHLRSPKDAIASGIGMVHQHFMLATNLTVLENVILGSEPTHGGALDFDAARDRIRDLSETYGVPLDPDRLVEDLAVGERQRVEILKVLYRGAQILILDEPTAVLVPQEVEELFRNLEDLKGRGVTIIFISHKLDEVLEIADSITVIRAGHTVATVKPRSVTARQLAELMVGSELPTPETRESTVTDEVMLSVRQMGVRVGERWTLQDVSFDIRRGEILGIAGVEGNGQRELVDAIMGMRPPQQGSIHLGGDDVTLWSSRRRREAGIGYVPEDRHLRGLLLPSPLWENAMLGKQTMPPFSSGPWIDRRGAHQRTVDVIREYHVATPGPDTPALALSGGNQQRLILGREMIAEPKVLIAAQPTRGIDVGAQAAVWEQIRGARAAGLALLLISADLEELIGLSDTLYVILRGTLVAKLDPATVTPEELGSYMTGAREAASA
ncbi:MAG TPA: ABC transporter ATP-binding protein [Actinomycetota bacterium]|nr:ABC transporter ATP-binding protein [Actinomycetota bacterium]